MGELAAWPRGRSGPSLEERTETQRPTPTELARTVLQYLEWIGVRGYTEATVRARRYELGGFVTWCADRDITRPQAVTRAILELYQRYLSHYRKPDGKRLRRSTQHGRLTAVRMYFRWLVRCSTYVSPQR